MSRLTLWLCLAASLGWGVLLRIPLMINAQAHLDSDLAVDGLTLREAVHGHWRWHYPGTPYTGTGAVLLSWPQARIWGANAVTLVSGGTVAHGLVTLAVFLLAWRVFGRTVALCSLFPLTFASTGELWLSGRITGGHLLVVAWSAWAWLLLHEFCLRRSVPAALVLGLWCGLGMYLDSMFTITLAALAGGGLAALVLARRESRRAGGAAPASQRTRAAALAGRAVLVLAFLVGLAPRIIGQQLDPHDPYHEQFSWSLESQVLAGHGRILVLDCLPRLVAGHRLPGLEADPDPALLGTAGPVRRGVGGGGSFHGWSLLLAVLALGYFAASLAALGAMAVRGREPGQRVVAAGLFASALVIAAGFLVNRNIFNSDNYRYLVLLIVPQAIGSGLVLRLAAHARRPIRCGATALVLTLGALYTGDAVTWYRRFGWIDGRLVPVQARPVDQALAWLRDHPEIRSIFGDYWDVYRLAFLSGRAVEGVPFPLYPNRFPEWSAGLPEDRPETLLARRSPEGRLFLRRALRQGGTVLHQQGGLTVVHWPWPASASESESAPVSAEASAP